MVKDLEYIMLKWKSSSYRQDLYFSQWYQDFEIIWIWGNTYFGFLKYTLSKYYFTFLCGNWTESQSFLCFQYPLIFLSQMGLKNTHISQYHYLEYFSAQNWFSIIDTKIHIQHIIELNYFVVNYFPEL